MATKQVQSKRIQINKAQATMLGLVIFASVVTVFSLVASKAFFSKASYLNHVAGEKEKAAKQLKTNIDAVSSLVTSYKSFASQNPNLVGGNSTASGERDGDNGRLVLDALPSKYDFPALATSLEKLLAGYTINSITGNDDATSQAANTVTDPVAMPFTINIKSDYNGIQKLSSTFEKSIRPFQIESMVLSGTNANIEAVITAQTFYQPEKNLKIDMKVVK